MIKAYSDNVARKGGVEVSGEIRHVATELSVIIGGVFGWMKKKDPELAEDYRKVFLMSFLDRNSVMLNLKKDDNAVEEVK